MGSMHTTWKGSISFGMVNIPVKAYKSTEEKTVAFNQLHRQCNTRTKSPTFCPTCDTMIERGDIIKGYEIRKGEYVVLDDSDFASVPTPSVKAIEIVRFVPEAEIDPVTVNKTYYVGPDEAAGKAYQLLRTALSETGLVAIAKWTYGSRERLAVIRIYGDVLSLQTMFWADEVRDAGGIDAPEVQLSDAEVEMAVQLVEAMKSPDAGLSDFHDEYREALLAMISEKDATGVTPSISETAVKPVADLMDALRASVEAAQKAKAAA